MPEPARTFPKILISLCIRLAALGAFGLLFASVPELLKTVQGWPYLMTRGQIAFEFLVYVLFVALSGALLGVVVSLLSSPFLLRGESRERAAERIVHVAVAITAFIDFRVLLAILVARMRLSYLIGQAVFLCYYLGFAAALLIPSRRRQLVSSLDGLVEEKTSRRAVLGLGAATAAVVVGERLMGSAAVKALPSLPAQRPNRNILFITFDALSAEDTTVYGYGLPTTPYLEKFAQRSTVFSNFFSGSTFTTPSVASILTGLYPSEHRVYHIPGRLMGDNLRKTLPRLMRAGGFATGASISSPYVYLLNDDLAADYDILPDMQFHVHDVRPAWNMVGLLHQRGGLGNPAIAFVDLKHALEFIPDTADEHSIRSLSRFNSPFPPKESFVQAREVLDRLPEGFFLWVHVMAPHEPYLPSAENLGRFLPANEFRTGLPQERFAPGSLYRLSQQKTVDKVRRRYDEFVADADAAFGEFMAGLEGSGRLKNTAVIISADHGESFQGGVYTHKCAYQTRPEIHIPLMIRLPGQQDGRRVHVTADQTSIAPTILECAGLSRPEWMRGSSLLPWMSRDGEGQGEGAAFTQYLERNSIYSPIRNGTVGMISQGQQYVVDLATGKGILRPLAEAESRDLDRSAENPALAQSLREAIFTRFPDLPRNTA
jgi:arylsulfatase A-like enzyme